MVENKTGFESIPTGTEKVLVVDDEERSVSIMKVVLERLGYNVTAMTSSLKALELFKEDPHRYDLLLTDLIMPQLDGDKLVSEIIEIRPDMPVIITSGFTDTIINDNFKQISNKAFIPKPFQPQELAKTVRQVLDRTVSRKTDL
jgi:DNA-binding NtrC family response regulator